MSFILAEEGYELQVGDLVVVDTYLGKYKSTITRVTKNYAFARVNEHSEAKYPRVYKSFGFGSVPRLKWETRDFKVYRKDTE